MDRPEWTAIGALILANLTFLFAMFRYFQGRINRIFERFDEYKDKMKHEFVVRDMCEVMHKGNADNLIKLEARVEAMFKSLDEKVTALLKRSDYTK